MRLGNIAHVRTGDKGDIAQFSVIAFNSADFPFIEGTVTVNRIRELYADLPLTDVRRYVLSNLGALIFVLAGAHGGGVTRSLALDPHGKTLGARVLDLELA